MLQHQVGDALEHIVGSQSARDTDRQALARELVDYGQHSQWPAILRSIGNEVIAPDVVRILGSKADAGSVVQPEPAALGLPLWHLEALLAPDSLDTLVVYSPSLAPQEGGDAAIPVAAELQGQLDDPVPQSPLLLAHLGRVALRRSRLPQDPAGTTLRGPQLLDYVLHRRSAALGA